MKSGRAFTGQIFSERGAIGQIQIVNDRLPLYRQYESCEGQQVYNVTLTPERRFKYPSDNVLVKSQFKVCFVRFNKWQSGEGLTFCPHKVWVGLTQTCSQGPKPWFSVFCFPRLCCSLLLELQGFWSLFCIIVIQVHLRGLWNTICIANNCSRAKDTPASPDLHWNVQSAPSTTRLPST